MQKANTHNRSISQKDQTGDYEIHPVVAGVAGAVVGAGIAVAGSYAMRDKKTKAKMEEVARTVGKRAGEYFKSVRADATNQLGAKAEEIAIEVKEVVSGKKK